MKGRASKSHAKIRPLCFTCLPYYYKYSHGGVDMGFFKNLMRSMPGGPRSVAKLLLNDYQMISDSSNHLSEKEKYKLILQKRYSVIKKFSEFEIDLMVDKSNTLVELVISVMAHENPASLEPMFREETMSDIFSFFEESSPGELDKFRKYVRENAG